MQPVGARQADAPPRTGAACVGTTSSQGRGFGGLAFGREVRAAPLPKSCPTLPAAVGDIQPLLEAAPGLFVLCQSWPERVSAS